MQGNLFATILALLFYVTSGIFGGNSVQNGTTLPSSSSGFTQSVNFPRSGEVTSKQANLRSESSAQGSIVSTVTQGSHLLVLGEKNDWYKVQADNGTEGWVAKYMVSSQRRTSSTLGRKVIAGYYVENFQNDPVGYNALAKNLGAINMVIPFNFKVDQYGNISDTHNPRPTNLAHSYGADALALVNNIQGGNFNSSAINRMLTSSAARTRAVNGIARLLVEKNYQGVNIDFENVPARDRIYVTAFFRELAAELRSRNLIVTASVPAKTYNDTTSSHGGAFDYKALAPYLDQVMIMTYDEHYSGGDAGPVASYPWVEKVIKYSLQSFLPSKIVIGIAGYGYDWSWNSGKALPYQSIQNLIKKNKIIPKWSFTNKVPYFSYKSWGVTHQVWYEDSRSTTTKVELVNKYGLRGVAVWRLGYEDPSIWSMIQQQLR